MYMDMYMIEINDIYIYNRNAEKEKTDSLLL